jgi:hypothetical protein
VSVIKQQEEQALRRLEDEKRMMLEQLTASSTQLEHQRADLDRQRVEWKT